MDMNLIEQIRRDVDAGKVIDPTEAALLAADRLAEAVRTAAECGAPYQVSLYDEEGVEGWRWDHADGRQWDIIELWDTTSPQHPLIAAALDAYMKEVSK